MKNSSSTAGEKSGFSLIELMVAITITSVLLVLLSTLLTTALGQWNRQTGRYVGNVDAQRAADILTDDLRSAVVKRDQAEWLHIRNESVEDLGEVQTLMFLTRPYVEGDYADGGDVCAVAYRVAKKDPFDENEPIHALYRTVLSPEDTLEHLNTENLYDEIWADLTDEMESPDNLLCAHLIGFDLEAEILDDDGTTRFLERDAEIRCIGASIIENGTESEAILRRLRARLIVTDRASQLAMNAGTISLEDTIRRTGFKYNAVVELPTPVIK